MTREEVYDQQIKPLVDVIADICDQHHIPTLMFFGIFDQARPGLTVSTTRLEPREMAGFLGLGHFLLAHALLLGRLSADEMRRRLGLLEHTSVEFGDTESQWPRSES